MTYRKKMIEVALPLDAINRESAREKSIRHGHPSTLHLWWARRPLASCRAVIFASLVDDPEQEGVPQELLDAIDALPSHPQGAEAAGGSVRRAKLFHLLEQLVKWANTTNEPLLETARTIIRAATGGNPPPLLDPFCGGGSIPLEGQRLGLEVYASDLNPVAVLITKALVEIPPQFAGRPPVNPEYRARTLSLALSIAEGSKGTSDTTWKGAAGLAADVRYYGKWMRDRAWERIGHLYPKGPKGETIIAWLWARTVKCPNPACGAQMPLVPSFWLSTKRSREVWLEPIVSNVTKAVRFDVRHGSRPSAMQRRLIAAGAGFLNDQDKKAKATFRCVLCGYGVAKGDYINHEADAGRMNVTPLAMVAEAKGGRNYPSFDDDQAQVALLTARELLADASIQQDLPTEPARGTFASNAQGRIYGFRSFSDYFTPRQSITLTTFCHLVPEARALVLEQSGGSTDYANAVATYLAFAVSRLSDRNSALCSWDTGKEHARNTFARQAITMAWDFAENNPFSESSGNWSGAINWIAEVLDVLPPGFKTEVAQLDTTATLPAVSAPLVVTDPPYYDNIGYSDLSDFFYVWLRRCLSSVHPHLFSTFLTPKGPELFATPYRFGGDKTKAKEYFEEGISKAFVLLRQQAHLHYPLTLYYAFKQTEEGKENGNHTPNVRASTGWETMLKGLLAAGFQVTGTWPIRTELSNRANATYANVLASSIVIACRPRPEDAPIATRREFTSALRWELPGELKVLISGQVAPVDLTQASIGPGMGVFSRYDKVLEADGSPMSVRTALQEINYAIDDFLAQQEGDLDVESQFCVAWFGQYGAQEGPYGDAEGLARAKNVAVEALARLGLVESARGKVRLTLRRDFDGEWEPRGQPRLTTWESCQRLVWTLQQLGEQEAGPLARRLGGMAEQARTLAYRLYELADRKGWAEEALGYNALVASWPEIQNEAAKAAQDTQGRLT